VIVQWETKGSNQPVSSPFCLMAAEGAGKHPAPAGAHWEWRLNLLYLEKED
jgi:hypothetical protein